MIRLRDNDRCYVCGKENPAGLGVNFEINREQRSISAIFRPTEHHQGYENIVHGGILSTLLDEAMGKLALSLGIPCMTVEMMISFKSPAAPGEGLRVSGRLVQETKKIVKAEARIERDTVLIAEATGTFVKISAEDTAPGTT